MIVALILPTLKTHFTPGCFLDLRNDRASLEASATFCTCTGSDFFCAFEVELSAASVASYSNGLLPFERPSSSLTTIYTRVMS